MSEKLVDLVAAAHARRILRQPTDFASVPQCVAA